MEKYKRPNRLDYANPVVYYHVLEMYMDQMLKEFELLERNDSYLIKQLEEKLEEINEVISFDYSEAGDDVKEWVKGASSVCYRIENILNR